jgi:hypothetical protein
MLAGVLGLPLASRAAAPASSIQLVETATEALVATPDGAGGTTYAVVPKFSATLTLNLAVPGLQTLPADSWSNLDVSLALGGLTFLDNLANANTLSATKAVFNLPGTDDLGNEVWVGQITFTKSANTLTVAGQLKFPVVANNYFGTSGSIQEAAACYFSAGDLLVQRNVYFSGKTTLTHRTVGRGDTQEDFDLNAVQVSGAAEFTAPTVSILAPAAGARLTNSIVTARARATDNLGVGAVQLSLNGSDFELGQASDTGTNVWVADLELAPGTNVLQAISFDAEGNVSATNTVKFSYVLTGRIALVTNPPVGGKISGVTNGQRLEIGRNYTATATPNTLQGWAFTHWTGGTNAAALALLTNKPALQFTMVSNLIVQANFIDTKKPELAITNPVAGLRVSNAVVDVKGWARDNDRVTGLWVKLNQDTYQPAQIANNRTNWALANQVLNPGTNWLLAYATDATGNRSATVSNKVIYVLSDRITLATNPPVGGKISGVTNGQRLEIGRNYTATATARTGYIFSNWTDRAGQPVTNTAACTFRMGSNMVLQANFVTNGFLAAKGTYNGLFYPTASQGVSNSGYCTLALSDKGTFSGSVKLAGATLNFSGAFDVAGRAQLSVPNPKSTPLQLTLSFNPAERSIVGWVSSGQWQAGLQSDLVVPGNAYAGSYTLLVPGSDDPASPPGSGAGTVTVSTNGTVTVSGTLADGTAITQSTGAAADGSWPLYVSLYGGRGLLLGPMNCNSNAPALWLKPAVPTDTYYRSGFARSGSVVVAKYTAPAAGQPVLGWTHGSVVLAGGNLPVPLTNLVVWSNNQLRALSGSISNLSLALTPANGLFSGTFIHPATRKPVTVKGALLQDSAGVYPITSGGWFLGTKQAGSLRLGP